MISPYHNQLNYDFNLILIGARPWHLKQQHKKHSKVRTVAGCWVMGRRHRRAGTKCSEVR